MPLWMSPRTAWAASERNPSERMASSTPWPCSQSSMKLRKGRPASGSTGFGVVSVSGRRRVPSPPASTSACTSGSSRSMAGPEAADARAPSREEPLTGYGRRDVGGAADALVREAGGHERVAVEEVASVNDQRVSHALLDLTGPVELRELRPFGHENRTVSAVERVERAVAELGATDQLGRSPHCDRVVDAHVRALALEARSKHECRRLTDVVGVRLESQPEQRDLLPDERPEVLLQLRDDAALLQLVDLDHRGEQLEVVARVAGELLQRRDVFREAVVSYEPTRRHDRVGVRDLEGVDGAVIARRPLAREPDPGSVARMAAVAGRRDLLGLAVQRLPDALGVFRADEVEHPLHLVGARDQQPVVVDRRLGGAADLPASSDPDVAQQAEHPVGERAAGGAVFEHHGRSAGDQRPRPVTEPRAGEQGALVRLRLAPDHIRDLLLVAVRAHAEAVPVAVQQPRRNADGHGGSCAADGGLETVLAPVAGDLVDQIPLILRVEGPLDATAATVAAAMTLREIEPDNAPEALVVHEARRHPGPVARGRIGRAG